MENEGQQTSLPPHGAPGQPGQREYYGWQYDQEHPEAVLPPTPSAPLDHPHNPTSYNANTPYNQPGSLPPSPQEHSAQPLPQRYQEPVADMGTSLGYGQGMEYQYFDAPQPTQGMARLRQERLQQLREERMRRQQRRMHGPDITTMLRSGSGGAGTQQPQQSQQSQQPPPQSLQHSPVLPPPQQLSPARGPNAQPSMQGGMPPGPSAPPTQLSPALSLPAYPKEASPAFPAPSANGHAGPQGLAPSAAPAQDTGMIQRERIGRASSILIGAFIASRLLGILRTTMFSFVFGATAISDAYLQSFLIPDLIFNIVAGGALSSAFIPVFTNYMVGENDEKTAWHIANAALNLAIAIMMGLALIAIILAPEIVPLYNQDLVNQPQQMALIVSLTRIMLLQAILLGGGVIVTAVLNARQNFLLPAIGTVLYNVGLIIGLLPGIFFAFHGRTAQNETFAVYAATWGVVLGAVLQVAIQIPGLAKVGMRYAPSFDWRHPAVRQVGRQMVPRIINSAMLYASTFVDRGLIQVVALGVGLAGSNGLITEYYQAFQLVLLPLGIFGMSVSTAAFPTLAENVAKGRIDRVRGTILETLRSILFLSIPSAIGLIVLGLTVIQVLLEHGHYSLTSAQLTAFPLVFFALGLPGLAAVEILTRSFYALRDSITPVIVSVGQFIFKIALSLLLINFVTSAMWGLGALAFSTSLAGLLEAVVLFWLLHQRLEGLDLRQIGIFLGRVMTAALIMGVCLFITHFVLDLVLVTTKTISLGLLGTLEAIIKLLIEIVVGTFVYLRCARMLHIEELGPIKRVLARLKLSWI